MRRSFLGWFFLVFELDAVFVGDVGGRDRNCCVDEEAFLEGCSDFFSFFFCVVLVGV